MKCLFTGICFLNFLIIAHICVAQQVQHKDDAHAYDFLPRESVIFEDNFSQDAIGTFPSKWRRLGEGASRSPKHCQVQLAGNDHVLVTSDIISDIEPNIDGNYLADSFTLEYDFMLGKDTNLNITNVDFRARQTEPNSFDWFSIGGNGYVSYFNLNTGDKQSTNYPGKFILNAWHHLAISYEQGTFKLYVDKYHLFTIPSYYGYPMFSFGLHCIPPGKVKNIRVATGKKSEQETENQFASLKISANADRKSLTVNVPSPVKENALVTITNMAGEKVKEFMTVTNTDKEIQLDTPPGIYFISAVTKSKTLTAKIVVQ